MQEFSSKDPRTLLTPLGISRIIDALARRTTGGTGTIAMGRAKKASVPPPAHPRVDWDVYFMNIARAVATRSTCPRKAVGAVVVKDRTILSTGYNGSVRGMPHCTDIGCDMENNHCVATVHAEANAIIQAARNGVRIDGADIYVTASPCWNCFKLIANSGIKRIFYGEFYRDKKSLNVARKCGVALVSLEDAGGLES